MRRIGILTGVALVAFAVSSASAQQPAGQRLAGTIEKVNGNSLLIKAKDGAEQTVNLAALNFEADVIHGGEAAEATNKVLNSYNRPLAMLHQRRFKNQLAELFLWRGFAQQNHKAALESRWDRGEVNAFDCRWICALGCDKPDQSAGQHPIDDLSLLDQP